MQILNRKEYPAKDGFENNKQLNIIARAILIRPEIVEYWKQIGHHDICKELNDLVLQGSLLIQMLTVMKLVLIRPQTILLNVCNH